MANKIRIEYTEIEGFRSYIEPVKFKFDKTGLYFILANNGSGKSSIFAALIWSLYKTNIYDTAAANVATWKHLRTKAYKGTRVITVFRNATHRFMVARHISYKGQTCEIEGGSSFMIFRKPAEDKSPFSSEHMLGDSLYKGDQQGYLNRVLGIDSDTFTNSVLFGQGMKRLMASKDSDLRTLFDTIFDTSWIEPLKAKAKEKEDATQLKLASYTSENLVLDDKILLTQRQYDMNKSNSDTYIETKQGKLKVLKLKLTAEKEHLDALNASLAVLEKEVKEDDEVHGLEELNQAYDLIREAKRRKEVELHKAENELTALETQKTSQERKWAALFQDLNNVKETCPTCKQALKPEKVSAVRKQIEEDIKANVLEGDAILIKKKPAAKLVEELTTAFNELDKKLLAAGKSLSDARAESQSTSDSQRRLNELNTSIKLAEQSILNIRTQGIALKAEQAPDYNLDKLEAELTLLKERKPVLTDLIAKGNKRLERIQFWTKKAFGSGGMKAFVFSAMLGQLNEAIVKYSLQFGFSVRFWVNLDKANKPFVASVKMGDAEVEYDTLSGGEKQRINVAVSFAMDDIINSKVGINISMLDEPTDGLDHEGRAMVLELVKQRAVKKAVYLVTHDPLLDTAGGSIIEIQKGTTSKIA